jgi:hypothetical protein
MSHSVAFHYIQLSRSHSCFNTMRGRSREAMKDSKSMTVNQMSTWGNKKKHEGKHRNKDNEDAQSRSRSTQRRQGSRVRTYTAEAREVAKQQGESAHDMLSLPPHQHSSSRSLILSVACHWSSRSPSRSPSNCVQNLVVDTSHQRTVMRKESSYSSG